MVQQTVKTGDQGPFVLECQKLLNKIGFQLSEDGYFGTMTELAVKQFQKEESLTADGVVGPMTWKKLEERSTVQAPMFNRAVVDMYKPLEANEYVNEKTPKVGIVFHHTVSDGNPETVIRVWNEDTRGTVGTHFVIGRTMVNGDNKHDGKVVQCIPIDAWAHHVLTTRMGFSSAHNSHINRSYIGIELCSWGALKKVGNKFYTLDGNIEIPANQVCILQTAFRTYQYWHKFSNAQINSLFKLTKALKQHFKFDFSKDGKIPDWFELSWDAMAARRVLTTHTNFEYGKFDTFPQPELINMINELYKL